MDLAPDPIPGGGPMNVAIAAARQRAPTAFVGRVSTDEDGTRIWSHLGDNGVDLRAAQRGPEPTARAIVERVPELRFRFEGTHTADTCLDPVDVAVFGPGPHILHGGTLGMFRGTTADVLLGLARAHDHLVSLDPNVRPQIIEDRARWLRYHDAWLERAAFYRGSDEDFAWIWPDRTPSDSARSLVDRGVRAVIVTRGANGADVFWAGGEITVPGVEVDVVDTVGAGDTFVATVLVGLHDRGVAGRPEALAGFDAATWEAIVARAVRAAATNCARRGADPPTIDELG